MLVICVVISLWPFIATENIVLYSNGWIPVSSDIVYEQIKRENIHVPSYFATHNIQTLNTYTNRLETTSSTPKIEEGFTGDVQIEILEIKCRRKDVIEEDCKNYTDNISTFDQGIEFLPKVYNDPEQKSLVNNNTRKSKKVVDTRFKDNVVQDLPIKDNKPSPISQDRTYEVTEKVNEDIYVEKDRKAKDNYESPQNQNGSKPGLIEILSKYKIYKDDKLTNYALSRRQKALIPLQQNLPVNFQNLQPVKNSKIFKYNSLNHLPVDPLLAVFLSNYGYYLQGMYGIQNHYNNLYGYLASNNIHNNRPFGTYKIFSDTDSSH